MAESTIVKLPCSHVAQFPDRCVVCANDRPQAHIYSGSFGTELQPFWLPTTSPALKAPACTSCARRFHRLHLVAIILTLAFLVAVAIGVLLLWQPGWLGPRSGSWARAFAYLFRVLDDLPLRGRWKVLLLAPVAVALGVALLPYILLMHLTAKPFTTVSDSEGVTYEFASRDYAIAFADLNRRAAVVQLDNATSEKK